MFGLLYLNWAKFSGQSGLGGVALTSLLGFIIVVLASVVGGQRIPEKGTVLITTRTRSYQDGPLSGSYVINTNELISFYVPKDLAENIGVKWAVYGGKGKICRMQKSNRWGQRVLYTCAEEGVYVAMFTQSPTLNPIWNDTSLFSPNPESNDFGVVTTAAVTESNHASVFEEEILQGNFNHSDPFLVVNNAYCYRWAYRLEEINAVGFLHNEANPRGSAGTFRVFEVKVWIMEPAAAIQGEVYWDRPKLSQSDYSRLITNRFRRLGITPCIREVHPSLEFINEPTFNQTEGIDANNQNFTARHWTFIMKLYLDRMVSYQSDITFTIKARQLSGLYGCFVADVRVFVKAKSIVFLKTLKFRKEKVHLNFSDLPDRIRKIIGSTEHMFGIPVNFTGPPGYNVRNDSANFIKIIPNACVSQELLFIHRETPFYVEDMLVTQELIKLILPGVTEEELEKPKTTDLPEDTCDPNPNNVSCKECVADFAFTPTHLVILRNDSTLLLHPSDLDLKGIGVNCRTKKFKLEALVRRQWCQASATPKVQNMMVPAFSTEGNIIIIYIVPLEEKLAINDIKLSTECAIPVDTTQKGVRAEKGKKIEEEEIHKNDPKTEIEAAIKHRSEVEMKRQAIKEEQRRKRAGGRTEFEAPDFWYFDNFLIPKVDIHFVQGETDPSNVLINITGKEFNRNVLFVLDKDFKNFLKARSSAGLELGTAHVSEIYKLHAVEFSGVEKRLIAAIQYDALGFKASEPDSITLVVVHYDANDLSTELVKTNFSSEHELEDVRVPLTGCIVHRKDLTTTTGKSNESVVLRTLNSAFPFYIVKLGDAIIINNADCSFARPLTFFDEANPTPQQFNVAPTAKLGRDDYDLIITKEGITSILFNSRNDADEQFILAGSILSNEPLRLIRIFAGRQGDIQLQMPTPEGEIVYGKARFDKNGVLQPPPLTRFYEVPFWSLLRGSLLFSLNYNTFILSNETVRSITPEETVPRHHLCAYTFFNVQYFKRNYADLGYRVRLTVEATFIHNTSDPTDFDIIVAFNEVPGISLLINSKSEQNEDLLHIRKTIEIRSYLSLPDQKKMFERHLHKPDGEHITDIVRVLTVSVRPSHLNLHCERSSYFETIQLFIGCEPAKKLRLLAENLNLEKQEIKKMSANVTEEKQELEWFWNEAGDFITAPRDRINFRQRALFQCEDDKIKFCKIPHAKLIDGNFYSMSYRDSLIPLFENFLTSHVRPVTGNIIIYDILESWKDPATRISVNTTQWDARCIADDENWYTKLAETASEGIKITNDSDSTKLDPHADLYRFYVDCFTKAASLNSLKNRTNPLAGQDRELMGAKNLSERPFWLFNHTNFNALRLNKTRNYVYIFRAVVINTECNSYTFCQILDTYFALRVMNVAPQREPLTWYIYLGIIFSVLVVVLASYIYFYRTYTWKTDLERDKSRLIEENRERLIQNTILEQHPQQNTFKRLAQKAQILARWKAMRNEGAKPGTKEDDDASVPKSRSSPGKVKFAKAGPSSSKKKM